MWIKICGVRTADDARMVRRLAPDAIGLNFHPGSKRYVEPTLSRTIGEELARGDGPKIETVGVFVNRTAAEIRDICRSCRIATVQLHGDEPPELAAELADEFPVIRAFRVGTAEGLESVARELDRYRHRGVPLKGCLVDALVAGVYGGSGQRPPWDLVATDWNFADWPPLILAGGLGPDNVAEAIAQVGPWGVDVAGGVENASGLKDPALVRSFIENGRRVGGSRRASGNSND